MANNTVYGQTGYFQISRTGDTTRPLWVSYALSGTAQEGVQYDTPGDMQYFSGHPNVNGIPFAYFAPGVTNILVGIYPDFDPANYGSASVTLSILSGGTFAPPNPAPNYAIGQTNATIDITDSDSDFWSVGFGFPSGIPVLTNEVVQGTGAIQREDGVSDIGYGPFQFGAFLIT